MCTFVCVRYLPHTHVCFLLYTGVYIPSDCRRKAVARITNLLSGRVAAGPEVLLGLFVCYVWASYERVHLVLYFRQQQS